MKKKSPFPNCPREPSLLPKKMVRRSTLKLIIDLGPASTESRQVRGMLQNANVACEGAGKVRQRGDWLPWRNFGETYQ